MTNRQTTFMGIDEVIAETGMGKNTAYRLAAKNDLGVPVHRFGKRFYISRRAWEAMKSQMTVGVMGEPVDPEDADEAQQ